MYPTITVRTLESSAMPLECFEGIAFNVITSVYVLQLGFECLIDFFFLITKLHGKNNVFDVNESGRRTYYHQSKSWNCKFNMDVVVVAASTRLAIARCKKELKNPYSLRPSSVYS